MGDGFLVEFASAVQAVTAAQAIQHANVGSGLPLRIGIHVGDVVVEGEDLMGDGVNIAARIEGVADAGGIVISRQVHDQVRDKLDVCFVDKGEVSLKNLARPVQVFTLGGAAPSSAVKPAPALALPDKPSIAVLPFQNMRGAKGRDKRPAFDKMLKGVTRREFDMIAAWSVERLGRSLQHLVAFLGEVRAAGVDLYLHQQALDTSTPAGKAMFQMCGVFAEFERAMIVERVNAGLKRAKAAGKVLGRPKIDAGIEERIRAALAKGDKGILKIAAQFGVGSGTVQRIKAESAAS